MPRLDPGFSLAMSAEMRAAVVALATKEGRSVGEMLRRLIEEALDERDRPPVSPFGVVTREGWKVTG